MIAALPKVGDYVMTGHRSPSLCRVEAVDATLGYVTHVHYVQIRYDGEVIGGGACLGGQTLDEFSPITDAVYLLAADTDRARRAESDARLAAAAAERTISTNTAAIKALLAAQAALRASEAPNG